MTATVKEIKTIHLIDRLISKAEYHSTTEQQLDSLEDKHARSRKPTNIVHMLTKILAFCHASFFNEMRGF